MPNTSQVQAKQQLIDLQNELALELILLDETDQHRVLTAALQIAKKRTKQSPPMRRQTPIYGLI